MEGQERAAKQPRLTEATASAQDAAAAAAAAQSYEVREAVQLRRVGRPEGWSESMGGSAAAAGSAGATARRPYLPVGALVCPARQVQLVRKALEKLDWMKQTAQRIHPYCAPAPFGELPETERRRQMAIHVSPVGAAALDAAAAKAVAAVGGGANPWAAELPAEFATCAAQLQTGEVRWCSGLRIGDAVEMGGLGRQWHLLPAEIKEEQQRKLEQQQQQQQQQQHSTSSVFRFIELFAGIGGFQLALETVGGESIFSSEIGADPPLPRPPFF
jgi:hypothetical protein